MRPHLTETWRWRLAGIAIGIPLGCAVGWFNAWLSR